MADERSSFWGRGSSTGLAGFVGVLVRPPLGDEADLLHLLRWRVARLRHHPANEHPVRRVGTARPVGGADELDVDQVTGLRILAAELVAEHGVVADDPVQELAPV